MERVRKFTVRPPTKNIKNDVEWFTNPFGQRQAVFE